MKTAAGVVVIVVLVAVAYVLGGLYETFFGEPS